ncbi:MAG: 50S ribosomal protein L25 [Patescibacteria group bacterium]
MTMSLTIEARDTAASADTVRDAGKVPAIVYGPKQEALAIAFDKQTFEKLYKEASESTIITLTGLKEDIEVLVKDLAFDPAKGGVLHADFYAIERGKEMTTTVPLAYEGEAPIEKSGATVNKIMNDVTVTCRPSALPPQIEVDLSGMDAEDSQITVGDLTAPEGVKIDNDPADVVASVSAARDIEAEEAAAAEAPDMDAIETEEKGKAEEGEGEAEKTE